MNESPRLSQGSFSIVPTPADNPRRKIHDITILQNLSSTTIPADNHPLPDPAIFIHLGDLLSYALTDEQTFAQAFPDDLMHQPIISGQHKLPGLKQDIRGNWKHIEPAHATPQDQRNYLQRGLMVKAARSILGILNRPLIVNAAATCPSTLPSVHRLTTIATDVCNKFDPGCIIRLNAPTLKETMDHLAAGTA